MVYDFYRFHVTCPFLGSGLDGGKLLHGIVTYVLPVEAFVIGIKILDWQKVSWITRSFPSNGF